MDRAAEISTSGHDKSKYSPTSCDSISYDAVERSRGSISMSPRSSSMLPKKPVVSCVVHKHVLVLTYGNKRAGPI